MNSTMKPSFKVVFLEKKVLAGPVNSTRDPPKNAGRARRYPKIHLVEYIFNSH